ncbi:hypothetical protein FA95DRAFT_1608937 [Auriscalpium vulgare]|uniref:Uncharacterized protein n=1 Tax=Auriscalpium vulgare TaxID=40419 RepID=A0ACB8RJB8_9AGAM|nr:hypothetical protein FA95DRAFT_1608937 [Auriscalpium vulgare]
MGPPEQLSSVSMQNPFTWLRSPQFSGKVLCAFERSPLPEHSGKRFVVMRVHKLLQSPRPMFSNMRNRVSVFIVPWKDAGLKLRREGAS